MIGYRESVDRGELIDVLSVQSCGIGPAQFGAVAFSLLVHG